MVKDVLSPLQAGEQPWLLRCFISARQRAQVLSARGLPVR